MSVFNNKFGVPLSGVEAGFEQGDVLHPKLRYRFRVLFYNFGNYDSGAGTRPNDLSQQIQSIGRPSMNFQEIQIPSFNSTAYVMGKGEWNPVEVTFRDDINGNVASLLAEQQSKQFSSVTQVAGNAGSEYKFKM